MSYLGRKLIRGLREGKSVWDLYKDKPFHKRAYAAIYHSDILDPLLDSYYAVRSFYKNIRRLIEYAPIVWRHRNWDYGYILEFNKKLHEDLYKGCFVEGHHVVNKNDTKRLKVVIALYDRIHKDEYDAWEHDYLEKKYGSNEWEFEPIAGTENKPGGPYSRMLFSREERMSEAEKKQYIAERKRMWKHQEYQQKQDLELLGKYIAKYSKRWWD